MIGPTGIWSEEEQFAHAFSENVAKYISEYFEKDKPVSDIGCGDGSYVKYLMDSGFEDVCGFDGISPINVKTKNIIKVDLTKDISANLGGVSGNVICLEVFEHIPKQYEEQFVENICNAFNGKLVLSVAVEGQPGLGHVNCRNNDYIINLFESKGFKFNKKRTKEIRKNVEDHVNYFRNTLMIFERP